MQQRRQRPGDIVDDYCPRERRITDHAIVAMVEDEVQRTRCVVCDAEHAFKNARVPAQRRKSTTATLFTQVLETLETPAVRLASPPVGNTEADAQGTAPSEPVPAEPGSAASSGGPPAGPAAPEEGVFRRSLIRAQLPRPEGQPPPQRAIPEFTMHQPQGRRRPGGGQRAGQGFGQPKHRGRRRGPGVTDSGLGPMRSGHGGDRQHGGHGRRRRGKKNR